MDICRVFGRIPAIVASMLGRKLEEVAMNKKCHRTKSFLSVTLSYQFNSYVSQVSQKENWELLMFKLGEHLKYFKLRQTLISMSAKKIVEYCADFVKP